MRTAVIALASVALLACAGRAGPGGGKGGANEEGFITTWLLLAPIPLADGQSGAEALGKQQLPGEAKLHPKAGDKVKVGGKELTWKSYRAKDYFFDFNDFLGQQTEDSVGYAVCYVQSPKEQKVLLKTGSDDQALAYLNGKEILKQDQARALEKDQDTTEVTLRAGENVLVLKVVNEKVDWSGCARFTDKDGNPVKDLRVTAASK